MIDYTVVQHLSGKFRLIRKLNNVVSFVNTNKKYFRTKEAVNEHLTVIKQQDERKALLKMRAIKHNKSLIVNL